jgi:hypothetical protein
MCKLSKRFVSRKSNFLCVNYDNEVAHIHVWCKSCFVLSAKKNGSMGCKAAKNYILCIDNVPFTDYVAGLWTICTHAFSAFFLFRTLVFGAALLPISAS